MLKSALVAAQQKVQLLLQRGEQVTIEEFAAVATLETAASE